MAAIGPIAAATRGSAPGPSRHRDFGLIGIEQSSRRFRGALPPVKACPESLVWYMLVVGE